MEVFEPLAKNIWMRIPKSYLKQKRDLITWFFLDAKCRGYEEKEKVGFRSDQEENVEEEIELNIIGTKMVYRTTMLKIFIQNTLQGRDIVSQT